MAGNISYCPSTIAGNISTLACQTGRKYFNIVCVMVNWQEIFLYCIPYAKLAGNSYRVVCKNKERYNWNIYLRYNIIENLLL